MGKNKSVILLSKIEQLSYFKRNGNVKTEMILVAHESIIEKVRYFTFSMEKISVFVHVGIENFVFIHIFFYIDIGFFINKSIGN